MKNHIVIGLRALPEPGEETFSGVILRLAERGAYRPSRDKPVRPDCLCSSQPQSAPHRAARTSAAGHPPWP